MCVKASQFRFLIAEFYNLYYNKKKLKLEGEDFTINPPSSMSFDMNLVWEP